MTVRCPHAETVAESAASSPGVAARAGEQAKISRYGAEVTPVSFETYGQIGASSAASLRSVTSWLSGRYTSGSRLYTAGRVSLELALAQEIAETSLQCLGQRRMLRVG